MKRDIIQIIILSVLATLILLLLGVRVCHAGASEDPVIAERAFLAHKYPEYYAPEYWTKQEQLQLQWGGNCEAIGQWLGYKKAPYASKKFKPKYAKCFVSQRGAVKSIAKIINR